MSNPRSGWAWALAAVTLVALAAVPIYLSSCTPGAGITAAESDVVVSLFDPDVDFGALKTYALVDSIYHVCSDSTGVDCPSIGRGFDDEILMRIGSNFQSRGYTPVADPNTTTPDFMLYVTAVQSDFYSIAGGGCGWYYPPGWGWYPGWCWGYPPTMTPVYSYSTGTLTITMLDPNRLDTADMEAPVGWTGAMNGVLNDNTASAQQRVIDSIDQLFTQSPYLQSNL